MIGMMKGRLWLFVCLIGNCILMRVVREVFKRMLSVS